MKKVFLMLAAAMLTASMNAQETAVTANKAGDNWYVGINGGVSTTLTKKTQNGGFFKAMAPTVGVRVGKNFTTVFGLVADADFHFKSNKKWEDVSKTFIEDLNVDLLGSFNLSNAFAGYTGQPRCFEVIALGGFGWSHGFNHQPKTNAVNSRIALDFALNFGSDKEWQLYLEPSLTYALHSWARGTDAALAAVVGDFRFNNFAYDINKSVFSLKLGINYKFGNSNGTHNYAIAPLRNQAEIDGLNAKINSLRKTVETKDAQIVEKDGRIEELENALDECKKKPAIVVEEVKKETVLQPIVIFRQGKSTIDAAQYASIEMIAKYMRNHKESKVLVRGYASPEGNPELNQKLSVARAVSVMTALINKYKIAPERITIEGMGATDKLSEEIDFNRVAMFIDTTK